MGSVKDDLLKQIAKKARKHEQLRKELNERNQNVEAFVRKILDELDEASEMVYKVFPDAFMEMYVESARSRITFLDRGAEIVVSWSDATGPDEIPRVNGILVKWSPEYQKANACEPELYVDVFQFLLEE